MARPGIYSDLTGTQSQSESSAPKCLELAKQLKKANEFEHSIENAINFRSIGLYLLTGILWGLFCSHYIKTRNDTFIVVWVVGLLLLIYAIYFLFNWLVIRKKSAWITAFRAAIVAESSKMSTLDAWLVADAARYFKAWATKAPKNSTVFIADLSSQEDTAIKHIIILEEESIRISKLRSVEMEMLLLCEKLLALQQ